MGDKPSWRDIDKRRDGRGSKLKKTHHYNNNSRSKISKAKLDQLFESKKLGDFIRSKEQEKNINSDSEDSLIVKTKRALRIQNDDKFFKEAIKIIDKEIPANFNFLERLLPLLDDIKTILKILEKMLEMLKSNKKPDFSRALKMHLKILPIKMGDNDIEQLCNEILDYL